MKKITILMFIAVFLALAVNAQSPNFPSIIEVTLAGQEPDPIGPGSLAELRFRVENQGESVANNIQVEILAEYPFSLRPGDSAVQGLGSLGAEEQGDDGTVAVYKVLVDKNAPDGSHEIRLRYKDNDHPNWVTLDAFSVRVRSNIAILSITNVVSNPTSIAPGDKARISLELRNYASSLLKDIVVKLDLSATSLNPSGSANERVISSIDPQKSEKALFDLIASPDATAGIVKIPVSLSYSDITGKNFTKSNTISLIIGDTPDISVSLDRSDIYTKGQIGDIVVKVVNKGTTDVKFMQVSVGAMEGSEIIGPSESYIGNLDSDDFSTAEFKLYPKDAKDSITIPITVEYKDANNNNYRKEAQLSLRLYSSKEAAKISQKGGSGMIWIALLIVLALIAFFVYRRWRRKKTQK